MLLLTLTWCHCSPAETKSRLCTSAISAEHDLDHVASACDGGWQGGADTLSSNINVSVIVGAAALLHQGCPVTVHDCQVVVDTGGVRLNIKCSELQ